MYMNLVMLAGFLAKDAVSHSDDRGNFTILELTSKSFHRDEKSNEYISRDESFNLTVFIDCCKLATTLRKGDHIIVTGELRRTEYVRDNSMGQSYTVQVTKLRRIHGALMAFLAEPDVEEISEELETE